MIEIEIKDLEEIIDRMNKNKVLSTSQRRSKEGRINKLESLYQQNENLDVKLNLKKEQINKIEDLLFEAVQEENKLRQNLGDMVNKIKKDRDLERMFLNYFNKYVKKRFLSSECYTSLGIYLLKFNSLYEKVKHDFPVINSVSIDSIYEDEYIVPHIDKMIEFMNKRISIQNKECAELLTWIEICDVAVSYYSNYFYVSYEKQIGNIDDLNLNECILKYMQSDIFYDNDEIQNMFIYYLMSLNKFEEGDIKRGYLCCKQIFESIYKKLKSESEYNNFISSLSFNEKENNTSYTIDDVDLMTGSEFEIFVGELFKKMGYKTIVTKATGDQGIDVIAEKNGIRCGIQAKCYSNTVTNSAIQEVVAGISFYKCDKAIVVTNNYFTSSAIDLANANGTVLWDRDMLKQKIMDLF